MKILLLSAYDAASHAYWHKGLVENLNQHQWTILTLPPRYFSWRIRGNSLSWAFSEREVLEQAYDLIIATSMTDLSALRGLVPHLASIPTLVYFHENQFAYPESGREYGNVEPKILNLYTALAADHICFNTHYNRNTFLAGCRELLKKLPDQVPAGIAEQLEQRSSVLQVPLPQSAYQPHDPQSEVIRLIWNHRWESVSLGRPILIVWAARWEYDKGPDRLLAIMRELESRGTDYRMCILGERFRNTPEEFDTIHREFSHRIDQFGFAESRDEYFEWLRCADIVLSTATHEFQGLSVLEAVAKGCIPVLPDRQAYPELFGTEYTYEDCGADIKAEAKAAADMIERQGALIMNGKAVVPSANRFSWSEVGPIYAKLFQNLAGISL